MQDSRPALQDSGSALQFRTSFAVWDQICRAQNQLCQTQNQIFRTRDQLCGLGPALQDLGAALQQQRDPAAAPGIVWSPAGSAGSPARAAGGLWLAELFPPSAPSVIHGVPAELQDKQHPRRRPNDCLGLLCFRLRGSSQLGRAQGAQEEPPGHRREAGKRKRS